jgi:bacteriorhodopsin|tara:strand:- start:476 stop:655 length:180 start_codon:yes stop_codon:yes gene_type:complete
MKSKNHQMELFDSILKSKTIKYVLYGIGAIALIYVSGIVMKVVGSTANSYKFMSNALKQ